MKDTMNGLDGAEDEKFYLPVNGGQYFRTGRNFPDQTEKKGFEVRECRSHGRFVLVSRSEAICLLVCPALYIYVHHPRLRRRK